MVQASRRSVLTRGVLARAFLLLAATAGLGACVADPRAGGYGRPPPFAGGPPPGPSGPGRGVAILLPLTGPNAELGQALLRAAQLALDRPDAPTLAALDTGGTPEGAVTAVRAAIDGGAGLVLGPLTNSETAAAAPLAKAAGVPVLSFTSDAAQAQPGVWPLGITAGQQTRRLALAVQQEGKTRLGAVLPQGAFGNALSDGLKAAALPAGMVEPRVIRHSANFAALSAALKDVSGHDSRRGAIEEQQRAARARGDIEGRQEANDLGQQSLPPPPIDALLLGTAGEQLGQAGPLLTFYDIGPSQVRILGPATWARETSRLGAFVGAWYAAPDPAMRGPFEQMYAAKYSMPAREYTSLAFDAASVARVVAERAGFPMNSLTRPEGFAGADGLLALQPDGGVRRGLAIFEVEAGGARVVQPAPQTLTAPGV